jgi:hypothetical protein
MDVERTPVLGTSDDPSSETQQPSSSKAGRPPPIVLTTAANLMQLQKRIRDILTSSFEFRNTRSGTRIVTKEMADFSEIRKHLENNNLSYFTFLPKSEKPIKAVVRHFPSNTPAQDTSDGLVDLSFDIISVKQMSASRWSTSEGSVLHNLPLFLTTLPRAEKSQEIFRLTALCHIAIRVEAYRVQSGLTQCHNCQQLGHVWANCRQLPRCFWCRGGHLHKECPEKDNAATTPACCNGKLAEGEKPHPTNYRGCRLAIRSCTRRNHKERPRPQREGCSPQTTLHQVSPSRRRSEVARSNNSNKRSRFQRRSDLQQRNRVSPLLYSLINQVSQLGLKRQSTTRQYVASSYRNTANYDRYQWCCVRRRKNSGHH